MRGHLLPRRPIGAFIWTNCFEGCLKESEGPNADKRDHHHRRIVAERQIIDFGIPQGLRQLAAMFASDHQIEPGGEQERMMWIQPVGKMHRIGAYRLG